MLFAKPPALKKPLKPTSFLAENIETNVSQLSDINYNLADFEDALRADIDARFGIVSNKIPNDPSSPTGVTWHRDATVAIPIAQRLPNDHPVLEANNTLLRCLSRLRAIEYAIQKKNQSGNNNESLRLNFAKLTHLMLTVSNNPKLKLSKRNKIIQKLEVEFNNYLIKTLDDAGLTQGCKNKKDYEDLLFHYRNLASLLDPAKTLVTVLYDQKYDIHHQTTQYPVTKKTESQKKCIQEMEIFPPKNDAKNHTYHSCQKEAIQEVNSYFAALLLQDDRRSPAQDRKDILPAAKNAYIVKLEVIQNGKPIKTTWFGRTGSPVYVGKGETPGRLRKQALENINQIKDTANKISGKKLTSTHLTCLLTNTSLQDQDTVVETLKYIDSNQPNIHLSRIPVNFHGLAKPVHLSSVITFSNKTIDTTNDGGKAKRFKLVQEVALITAEQLEDSHRFGVLLCQSGQDRTGKAALLFEIAWREQAYRDLVLVKKDTKDTVQNLELEAEIGKIRETAQIQIDLDEQDYQDLAPNVKVPTNPQEQIQQSSDFRKRDVSALEKMDSEFPQVNQDAELKKINIENLLMTGANAQEIATHAAPGSRGLKSDSATEGGSDDIRALLAKNVGALSDESEKQLHTKSAKTNKKNPISHLPTEHYDNPYFHNRITQEQIAAIANKNLTSIIYHGIIEYERVPVNCILNRGIKRAHLYKTALENNQYTDLQMLVMGLALLSSHDGATLKKSVSKQYQFLGTDSLQQEIIKKIVQDSNIDIRLLDKIVAKLVVSANTNDEAQFKKVVDISKLILESSVPNKRLAKPKEDKNPHRERIINFLRELDISELQLHAKHTALEGIKRFLTASSYSVDTLWPYIQNICQESTTGVMNSIGKAKFFYGNGRHPLVDIIYHAVLNENSMYTRIIYNLSSVLRIKTDLGKEIKTKYTDLNQLIPLNVTIAEANYYKNIKYAAEKYPDTWLDKINSLDKLSELNQEREIMKLIDAEIASRAPDIMNSYIKIVVYQTLLKQIHTNGIANLNFNEQLQNVSWEGNEKISADDGSIIKKFQGDPISLRDALCWIRNSGLGETTSETIYRKILDLQNPEAAASAAEKIGKTFGW